MTAEKVKEADSRRKGIIKELLQRDKKDLKFCVMGAGHGGLAMAGHLALMGMRVRLFNRGHNKIRPLIHRPSIRLEGEIQGDGPIELASSHIEECLQDVDIIMVAVPANGHRYIAQTCAPHLKEQQVVILNPGRTGGTLEFLQTLRECGATEFPFLAEAQTFIYTSRAIGPTQARIFAIKYAVPLATLPAYWIPGIVKIINRVYPQFVSGDNIFKTGFDNIGAIFHPALTVLNAAWIEETHGDFDYYIQGASDSVCRVLERMDKERLEVAAALGIKAMSARTWLYTAYSATGKNLHEAIHANRGYVGISGPDRLRHRYIDEDVPMSLVPLASIGEMLKVDTPTIQNIIHLASLMREKDFWKEGRTVDKLGIQNKSIREIRLLAVSGEI